eukprot:1161994-Pelagomonas_calceolata.AAC.5
MPHILVSSFLPPQNGLAHGQDPDSKSCKDTQSLVSGAFDPPGPRAQHRLHARQNQASSKVNGGAHSYKSSPPYINYSSTPVLSTTSTRPLRESIEMHLPRPRRAEQERWVEGDGQLGLGIAGQCRGQLYGRRSQKTLWAAHPIKVTIQTNCAANHRSGEMQLGLVRQAPCSYLAGSLPSQGHNFRHTEPKHTGPKSVLGLARQAFCTCVVGSLSSQGHDFKRTALLR